MDESYETMYKIRKYHYDFHQYYYYVIDFQLAHIRVLKTIFGTKVHIITCYFHFQQALVKKLNSFGL